MTATEVTPDLVDLVQDTETEEEAWVLPVLVEATLWGV